MALRKNMRWWDRTIRYVLGIGLLGYATAGGPWWAYLGLYPLATAAFGYCPSYALLGLWEDT